MLAVVAFVSCLLFISVAKLVSGKTALPLVVKAQHEGANNVVVEAAERAGILNGESSEVVPVNGHIHPTLDITHGRMGEVQLGKAAERSDHYGPAILHALLSSEVGVVGVGLDLAEVH